MLTSRSSLWAVPCVLPITALTLVPVAVVLSFLWQTDPEIWQHLRHYVLPELIWNTITLSVGVTLGVTVLGVASAWLNAACHYPGRRFFSWALLLPLAVPAYVSGFIWIGLLDFTGTLPTWLREHWGYSLHIPIRSRWGVMAVMTLALYPYVYLTTRSAFLNQGSRLMEAAQSLGRSRSQAFFQVVLPTVRPSIVAGVLLALMETLADFGTVSVFNYNTFTTAIYKAWFALFSLPTAAQLASLLILGILLLGLLESAWRARQPSGALRSGAPQRMVLHGLWAWAATLFSSTLLLLALLIPLVQLLLWSYQSLASDLDERYWQFSGHSLLISGIGAALVACAAIVLSYAQRLPPGPSVRVLVRLAGLGYALPGAVLAVGVYIPIAWLDNQFIDRQWVSEPLLAGSLVTMLLAYCARFMAVGLGPIESGLQRIHRSLDEASLSLGQGIWARLRRVHLPLLRLPILSALALCFVDLMKELPITLMTRPFGWDTLAVRVFEMTSEGEWERAALPALAITLVGLIPVILLLRSSDHAQR